MASGSTWRKIRCLQSKKVDIFKPALLCRDQVLVSSHTGNAIICITSLNYASQLQATFDQFQITKVLKELAIPSTFAI